MNCEIVPRLLRNTLTIYCYETMNRLRLFWFLEESSKHVVKRDSYKKVAISLPVVETFLFLYNSVTFFLNHYITLTSFLSSTPTTDYLTDNRLSHRQYEVFGDRFRLMYGVRVYMSKWRVQCGVGQSIQEETERHHDEGEYCMYTLYSSGVGLTFNQQPLARLPSG